MRGQVGRLLNAFRCGSLITPESHAGQSMRAAVPALRKPIWMAQRVFRELWVACNLIILIIRGKAVQQSCKRR